MVILHAFLALIAGFLVAATLSALLAALTGWLAPDWAASKNPLTPGAAFVQLAAGLLSTAAGGYVAAWIGAANPLQHVLVLGMTFLVLTALNALQMRGKQPVWFLLAQVALMPLGALAGGLAWLRFTGVI